MAIPVSITPPVRVDSTNVISDRPISSASARANSNSVKYDDASLWQALGNIITGNLDYKRSIESAIRAERVSAREAERTRRWQEEMSNSAYSRAIADLRRNGINPYAIGYFSPASTPAGATGSAYNTSPHSASSSTLGALGLAERAFTNSKQDMKDLSFIVLRLIASIFGGN